MAKTLTQQISLFPSSGATLFTKGDPLHARLMFDGARAINNLWAYCDVPVVFLMDPYGYTRVQMASNNVSQEFYVGQVPVMIPRGAKRLAWTVGLNVAATVGETTTLTAVSIYLSATPYTGAVDVFDVTLLSPGYGFDTIADSLSANNAVGAYRLEDRSAVGMTPVKGLGESANGRLGYLIVTLTGKGTVLEGLNVNYADVRDFTAWVLKE